jgi:hypothetical protein
MKHKEETNFQFIKHLTNAKQLANIKIGNFYGSAEQTENTLLRSIYYKKQANEYKVSSNPRRISLTEYINKKEITQKVKR